MDILAGLQDQRDLELASLGVRFAMVDSCF